MCVSRPYDVNSARRGKMSAWRGLSHSCSMFVSKDGIPMRFYVRPGPRKRHLSPLITHGGGIMCRFQEPGAFLLAEPGEAQGLQYISCDYVTDCVREGRRLSPRTYRMSQPTRGRGKKMGGPGSPTGATPEKDHRVLGRCPATGGALEKGRDDSTGESAGKSGTSEEGRGQRRESLASSETPTGGGPRRSPASSETPTGGGPRRSPASSETPTGGGPRRSPASSETPTGGGPRRSPASSETPTGGGPRRSPASSETPTGGGPRRSPASSETPTGGGPRRSPASSETPTGGGPRRSPASSETPTGGGPRRSPASSETPTGGGPRRSPASSETPTGGGPRRSPASSETPTGGGPRRSTASSETPTGGGPRRSTASSETTKEGGPRGLSSPIPTESTPVEGTTEEGRGQRRRRRPSLSELTIGEALGDSESLSEMGSPAPRASTLVKGAPRIEESPKADTGKRGTSRVDIEADSGRDTTGQKRKSRGGARHSSGEDLPLPNVTLRREQTDINGNNNVKGKQIGALETQSTDDRTEPPPTRDNRTEPPPTGDNRTQQPPTTEMPRSSGSGCPVGRTAFTKDEDMVILLYVRDNESSSSTVTGNQLWKDLEKKQLLKRTWLSMRSRYLKCLLKRKHEFKLPPKELPHKNKVRSGNESSDPKNTLRRADASPANNTRLCANASPAVLPVNNSRTGVVDCTDNTTDDEEEAIPGTSGVIRHVINAKQRIPWKISPNRIGNRMSAARSPEKSILQDNQESEDSEDLHIFEIANMEFEVDDTPSTEKSAPALGLKEFVMGEDSVSADTQMELDEVSSIPDVSDGEGLQEALTDMMNEFKLDLCHVTQALLKNNGEVGSTKHFLRTGRRPDGYPIWERRDDLELPKNDPNIQTRLAKKFGVDNVARRMAFLAS